METNTQTLQQQKNPEKTENAILLDFNNLT